jgi:hypothetical protein
MKNKNQCQLLLAGKVVNKIPIFPEDHVWDSPVCLLHNPSQKDWLSIIFNLHQIFLNKFEVTGLMSMIIPLYLKP